MSLQHLRLHSHAAELLLACLEQADSAIDALVHARAAARYGSDYRRVIQAKDRAIARRDLQRLADRKLLRGKMIDGELRYALTGKGHTEACRLAVLDCELFEDGRMTLVVFDIPESHRQERRMLRAFLSTAGFAPLQKSTWISPFNAAKALDDLFIRTNTRKWVRVFIASEVIIP